MTHCTIWIFLLEQTVFLGALAATLVRTVEWFPFSTKDNGGDLVETSFLCQGLLAVREYFKTEILLKALLTTKQDPAVERGRVELVY
jgi:hypothetical protein